MAGASMSADSVALPDVERCRAFWAREEVDRPLLAAWIGSYEAASLYPRGLAQLPEGELKPSDLGFELFRQDYEALFESHRQAAVDVPWSAFPLLVMPWLEAIAGCRVVHRSGNVWAEPWLDSYDRLDERLQPRLDWLAKLTEFTEWLVALSHGRFAVGVSLLRGPADVLAAMRGAQESVLDLMDAPEGPERVLDWVTDLWIQAARAQLSHIRPFAGGYGWSIQNLWSEEPGGWFQDDAMAYWSPSLYRRYAAPREAKLSKSLPRTGCHLHPPAIFTVDGLLEMPELGVIEMNQDISGERIPEMIPVFRRILETRRLFVWGHFTREDLVAMKEKLPARGLALQPLCDTPEEVRAIVQEVERIWLE